ncbi:MAG TPA: 16S rRNA (cytosine(967)-C(5))-methyltransferase RsmB [Burkholderiales bacterium]|nr:16S rRNA (cytosine(967)-C(5))-methyltransferase RsmB [Burkholderiales bacterium]
MIEAQRLASLAVSQVLEGHNLTSTLSALWRRQPSLGAQQRAQAQELAYGTLRYCGEAQALLGLLLEKTLRDDKLRALLLVSLYQLQYGKAAPYAVVDHAVNAAATLNQRAAKGLVNAVLRNFLRHRESLTRQARDNEVGLYSHPQWWIDKLKAQYPHQYQAILLAANQHPPMTLRVNRRASTKRDYHLRLQSAQIEAVDLGGDALMLKRPLMVEELPGFAEGQVSVQDAAAQRAAPLLDVRPGMRVLDACAAPGGKTAHILEQADAEVTALDNDGERLRRVEENLRRLKLKARIVCGDAGQPATWWDGVPYQRILADVPCSASGVVRRHPDIKWLRRETDVGKFAGQQSRILDALWQCLDGGGKLLYVTCSVFAEENRQQVDAFLGRHKNAELQPLNTDGQLLPDSQHDGFFYALLRKI